MRVLIFLLLFLPSICFAGFFDFLDPLDKVEQHIMAGNYNEAKRAFLSIDDKKFIFENKWAVIGSIDYLSSSLKFVEISTNEKDAEKALEFYRNVVRKDDGKIPRSLPFSREVVAKINEVITENNKIANKLEGILKDQQLKRQKEEILRAQEEERKRQEHQAQLAEALRINKEKEESRRQAERIARDRKWAQEEAERKAEIERQKKERKEKEAAEKQRMEGQRLAIDTKAKAAGYKGLYDSGIVRFLYKVKHGGNLQDGLRYVFWSDLSDNERKLDNKFEATQLLDGMIIYSLLEFTNSETIEFTIMIPDKSGGMFLEGQRLRHSCYTYDGNGHLTTVLGVERTIPIFKPVSDQICNQ